MPSTLKRLALAAFMAFAVLVALPGTASAHTGLSTSTPADGATVGGPLAEVTLTFTGTPTAFDDSVAVADAAGVAYAPTAVVQTGLEVVATFEPPLPPGSYALAWQVRSDDTHYVDGSFSFAVAAPIAPAAPSETGVPQESADSTQISTPAASVTPVDTEASAEAAGVPSTEVDHSAMEMADGSPMSMDDHESMVAPPVLGGSAVDTAEGDGVTQIGRLLYLPAGVVAVGMVAFAGLALVGRTSDREALLRTVCWLGVFMTMGALLEVVGLSSLVGGLGALVELGPGRASLVRLVAGFVVVAGFASIAARSSTPTPVARTLSAAVIDHERIDQSSTDPTVAVEGSNGAWRPTRTDVLGIIGLVLFAFSFAFDGHTVSRGPRLLHSLASGLHVIGAAVWAGGLVALAAVLWRRRRSGVPTRALEMIVRFSVVAMAALAVTGAAGVAMALFIDSDVFGYLSNEWGRYMIAKTLAVAVAGGIGAWNHFVVLPALTARPDDSAVIEQSQSTVTIEAVFVVVAAFVTALLVAASTL